MYNAQIIKDRIKLMRKKRNISENELLVKRCSLGPNAIRQISDNNDKGIASISLAKIADSLDCSVDYLLGRTDNPNAHKPQTNSTINQSNVNSDYSTVTVNSAISESDGLTQEFIKEFNNLAFFEKVKVMNFVSELKGK